MINLTGNFYFKFDSSSHVAINNLFNRMQDQSIREAITFNFRILSIENESWLLGDGRNLVKVNLAINIDESYYCLAYDEHEIKTFVKRYLKYNLDDFNFEYQYAEDIEISKVSASGKRNSVYDNYCDYTDKEVKPIKEQPKVITHKVEEGKLEERAGRKRRVFVLNDINEG